MTLGRLWPGAPMPVDPDDEPAPEAPPARAPGAEDATEVSSDPETTARRSRGRATWVWPVATLVILLVVAVAIATNGFQTLGIGGPSGPFPSSAPGGTHGGGGGDGDGDPGEPSYNYTVLSAGTSWPFDGEDYHAVWFEAPAYSAVWGNLRATGPLTYVIVNASAFAAWAGGNASTGHAGALSTLTGTANWSRSSSGSTTLTDEVIGPGEYDFVVVDSSVSEATQMTVTGALYQTAFDTS
jgi:hypothetical protein